MKEKAKKIYEHSRFWAHFFFIVLMMVIIVQGVTGIINREDLMYLKDNIVWLTLFVEKETPMQVASYIWTVLVAFYCGMDRVVDISETMHMPQGQMSMGELGKLRVIIVESFVAFFVAFIFDRVTASQYDFQAGPLLTAWGISLITYITGNKLCKTMKYKSLSDENNDGIPDEFSRQYKRWKLEQSRNEINPKFVNFDYFLADNPEIEEKIHEMELAKEKEIELRR